jgi:hypothetical protein
VLERFLAWVTLAEVEGKFVLSGPDLTKHVVISLPLKKGVADAGMAVVSGVVEWGPLSVILRVDIGSALQEQDAGFQATLLAG